jgi:site-specific recombinase XerD
VKKAHENTLRHERVTMDDHHLELWLDPWLVALRDVDRAPRTVNRYRGAARRFLAWLEVQEQRSPTHQDLTPIAFQGYRNALQKTEATSTVNTHICALRSWCAWLLQAGHIPTDPTAYLKLVRRTRPESPRGLKDTEINALLRAAQRSRHPERDYAMLQVMVQTGIRIGECAALQWHDIAFSEKSGRMQIRAGKGNKARAVPLNGSARSALAAYVAPLLGVEPSVRAVAAAWPQPRSATGVAYLWQSQMNSHLSESGMWRVITGLVADCAGRGLVPDSTTPHDLRHTFAHRYLDEHPGDLVGLAHLLGHTSLDTTSIYTQPTTEELAQRVDQLSLNAYTEDRPSSSRRFATNKSRGKPKS